MSRLIRLNNPMINNAWGTTDVLPALLGVENPAQEPQAEIWVGAHPKAPSQVICDSGHQVSLIDWMSKADAAQLGVSVVDKFGKQLPFLFKILSAATPLSIQVHPNKAQAESGFARENTAGIALNAPERNYKDDNHKPEIMWALTPFCAMVGFRPLAEMSQLLAGLELAEFTSWLEQLQAACQAGEAEQADTLRAFYQWLMSQPKAEQRELALQVTERSVQCAGEAYAEVGRLAENYPGDIGVVSPLLLNTFELKPGQAVYLDAGTPHAYLRGTGIEVMGCSDNVLRGGLTPKHIDIDELLNTIVFKTGGASVIAPEVPSGTSEVVYPVPVEDFCLSVITLEPAQAYSARAERNIELLYCFEGEVEVQCGDEKLSLKPADAMLVPADADAYVLNGKGRVAKTTA